MFEMIVKICSEIEEHTSGMTHFERSLTIDFCHEVFTDPETNLLLILISQ